MKNAIKFILVILVVGVMFWNRSPAPPSVGTKLSDAIPAQLVDSEGNEISGDSLKGKYVGVYFSAHWCPPCQVFTPILVKFRDENVKNNFEVLFVSADYSEKEKQLYISQTGMKWPSVPGAGSPAHRKMEERFGIPGYPSLIILGPDGTVLTNAGVDEIMISPGTAMKRWMAKNG